MTFVPSICWQLALDKFSEMHDQRAREQEGVVALSRPKLAALKLDKAVLRHADMTQLLWARSSVCNMHLSDRRIKHPFIVKMGQSCLRQSTQFWGQRLKLADLHSEHGITLQWYK